MTKHKKSGRGIEAREIGNFQYERPGDSPGGFTRRPAPPRRSVDTAVLKRAYILQNFQFVLRRDVQGMKATPGLPHGQRRLNEALISADSAPPWDAVTAVVVRWTLEEFNCPICLETPAAARIADCGHAFCLPCMLQYLSRRKAENKQRNCPVCHNFITLGMLRPCILKPIDPPHVGKNVCFTLLRRQGGSCVLLRRDDRRWSDLQPMEEELPLPFINEPSATHSRYILATAESEATQRSMDCIGIMERLSEIQTHVRPLTQFDDEVERFCEEALAMVLQEGSLPQQQQQQQSGLRSSPPIAPKPTGGDAATMYDLYGESEGQPYYLHPLSFKMLREDANARQAPLVTTVEAPLEEMVSFTQDEASRRHYKAFAHVPLHGTIKLCLLDLANVVLPSTLQTFAASIARMREARRQREAFCKNNNKSNNNVRSGVGTGVDSSSEDASWQAYLRRYRAESEVSPEFAPSDFSGGSERLPFLELPSPEGSSNNSNSNDDSSLATRQRATKRHDNPITNCWAIGNTRRLFATPPMQPALPTWGGHAFNPRKPPTTTPRAENQTRK